jgi:hypothetical protein
VMSEGERLARIDEWDHAARMTLHGKPIELRKAPEAPRFIRPAKKPERSPAANRQNPAEDR